ncbi:MAG: T3SS effector HopA1 family protein [Solirubrobacteraceae bacterium]
MTDYASLLSEVFAATEVVSATSYTWFGVRAPALDDQTVAMMGPESARAYLVYNLQTQLYADFYCAGRARPRLDNPLIEPLPGASPFVHVLSEANAGHGAREPGWTVVGREAGALVVTRGGLSLWVAPADVTVGNGDRLGPGASVSVLMPKELLRLSPGFYMALGDAEFPIDGSSPIVRFYWNLRSRGAPALLDVLTRALNAERLGFRLKVVSDPGRYSRCDAGVLYTRRDDYERVGHAVLRAYRTVVSELKPDTPALTRKLAPGLALAEDPGGDAVSFGMSRCALVADAIVGAAEHGVRDPAQRLEFVRARFAQDGLALEAPYLNGGSADDYSFPWP